MSDLRVRIGVSACLLGQPVRFDGGHKRNALLADAFGPYVEWIPVCPEQEAGFGTPREAMRLVADGVDLRLATVHSARDVTAILQQAVDERVADLAAAADGRPFHRRHLDVGLDGFVFKKDSPSCGLTRVKVYPAGGGPGERRGRGLFAAALTGRLPWLPVEEEGRLADARIREHFIARVFASRRLRLLLAAAPRRADLMRFHAQHKLMLLAHAPLAYARLGRLAAAHPRSIECTLNDYAVGFTDAMARAATRPRHVNVLQHMAGYFRRLLPDDARRDLAAVIDDYQQGLVPLVVPTRLIAHHARCQNVRYLVDQCYLDPYPRSLTLRNHV